MKRGRFITLEGGEGAGKSTQASLLLEALHAAGIEAMRTREPGGSPGAEEIRRLLVEGAPGRWDPETEALLMVAARRSHLVETVWPALKAGRWVISDRFADSTIAYQGYGRGVARDSLKKFHKFIAGEFKPDLSIILDLPIDKGILRAVTRSSKETRFERMDSSFHERLRRGFLAIAKAEPKRCVVIDGNQDPAAVHAGIKAAIRRRLGVKI